MKNILFYTDTPLVGGAEQQMLVLAKYLRKDRYCVTLACSGYQSLNPWCQQFIKAGSNVIRLKVFHKHDPRHFLYLKKLVPQFNITHIHAWNPASCRYALAAAAGRSSLVVTEHDPFRLNHLKGWLKRKLMQSVRRVIVASEGAKKNFLQELPELDSRVAIVRNGIDVEAWHRSTFTARSEFRRANFGIVGHEKIILCVAELHPRKGQQHLLHAWHMCCSEFPDAKLIFVGDGPVRRRYETLARRFSQSVLFLGKRRDVPELMAAADYFVLPSVREAFGLVLLEAALSNLPVIASAVGGIPEIISPNVTGYLVPPENPEKLAQTLREVLKEPQRARAYAVALKKRVEQDFTAQKMAQETEKVYDEALGNIADY